MRLLEYLLRQPKKEAQNEPAMPVAKNSGSNRIILIGDITVGKPGLPASLQHPIAFKAFSLIPVASERASPPSGVAKFATSGAIQARDLPKTICDQKLVDPA